MSRLLVHVEGQTEEAFVNTVLAPHLYRVGYTSVGARLLGNARQRSLRGSGRSWQAVRKGILKHLQSDQAALSTTMVDYYGLPRTWPGRERPSRHATLSERAATVERAVLEDISTAIDRPARFVPYVVMHEFEGLLFSDPDRFAQSLGKPSLAPKLRAVRREFQTPEDINDSPDKSPSKRILTCTGTTGSPSMECWPWRSSVSTPCARRVRSSTRGSARWSSRLGRSATSGQASAIIGHDMTIGLVMAKIG